MGKKIAISGAHSTGKTTFLKYVQRELESKGVSCCMVSDLASKCPLPILREHTIESTLWIVTAGIADEIEKCHNSDVVLVDRPVLDAWAYLMAIPNADIIDEKSAEYLTLQNLIANWIPTYTKIYKSCLDETIKIENNKGRDLDPEYRLNVANQMEQTYLKFNAELEGITSSNSLERIKILIENLEKY